MADASTRLPKSKIAPQDQFIMWTVRFFRAEWSGALLAIIVLGIAIEIATPCVCL